LRHDSLGKEINAVGTHLGLARTIFIRCTYVFLAGKSQNYTVIYILYKCFWPTLPMICCSINRMSRHLGQVMCSIVVTRAKDVMLRRCLRDLLEDVCRSVLVYASK